MFLSQLKCSSYLLLWPSIVTIHCVTFEIQYELVVWEFRHSILRFQDRKFRIPICYLKTTPDCHHSDENVKISWKNDREFSKDCPIESSFNISKVIWMIYSIQICWNQIRYRWNIIATICWSWMKKYREMTS